MDNRAVGVMDSGVGGLTVARVLAEKYPKEGIVFLGDTARNPYGERPVEEIVRFSEAIKDFLLKKDVKMILVACNTISFNVPPSFLEGDVPVIKMSMNVALPEDAKKIAVFATPATISAHSHKKYLAKAHPEVETVEIPCEGLAAAIERNEDKNSIRALLQSILIHKGRTRRFWLAHTSRLWKTCSRKCSPASVSSIRRFRPSKTA